MFLVLGIGGAGTRPAGSWICGASGDHPLVSDPNRAVVVQDTAACAPGTTLSVKVQLKNVVDDDGFVVAPECRILDTSNGQILDKNDKTNGSLNGDTTYCSFRVI